MIPPEELRHVLDGPRPDERSTGAGLVEVTVEGSDVDRVLTRSREVMRVVLESADRSWPSVGEWSDRLPAWFVEGCAPEPTEQRKQDWLVWWRSLEPTARASAGRDKPWSLADWLFWLEPAERQWYWWDARTRGSQDGSVWVEVPGWPAPVGALEWLLRTAGARSVEAADP